MSDTVLAILQVHSMPFLAFQIWPQQIETLHMSVGLCYHLLWKPCIMKIDLFNWKDLNWEIKA
jgi:hypothetical protein